MINSHRLSLSSELITPMQAMIAAPTFSHVGMNSSSSNFQSSQFSSLEFTPRKLQQIGYRIHVRRMVFTNTQRLFKFYPISSTSTSRLSYVRHIESMHRLFTHSRNAPSAVEHPPSSWTRGYARLHSMYALVMLDCPTNRALLRSVVCLHHLKREQ